MGLVSAFGACLTQVSPALTMMVRCGRSRARPRRLQSGVGHPWGRLSSGPRVAGMVRPRPCPPLPAVTLLLPRLCRLRGRAAYGCLIAGLLVGVRSFVRSGGCRLVCAGLWLFGPAPWPVRLMVGWLPSVFPLPQLRRLLRPRRCVRRGLPRRLARERCLWLVRCLAVGLPSVVFPLSPSFSLCLFRYLPAWHAPHGC